MDAGYAFVKAVVQGLTEFLPVSSTAHLLLVDAIGTQFGWSAAHNDPRVEEFFDILLHMGTLLAVLVYFRGELKDLAKTLLATFKRTPPPSSGDDASFENAPVGLTPWHYPSLGKALLISFATTAVLALSILKGSEALFTTMGWATATVTDVSEWILAQPKFVILNLTLTGCLLWWVETRPAPPARITTAQGLAAQADTLRISTLQALRVGAFQTLAAVFHGISRSGSTITGGMLNGWDRATAAKYSFLLSIPTFSAAMVYESIKLSQHAPTLTLTDMLIMVGATLVSGLVGYACIGWFIPYLSRASLKGFALYCWGVVALMLVVLK